MCLAVCLITKPMIHFLPAQRKEQHMKTTHKILVIGVVLLFAGAALAFANGPWGGGYYGGHMMGYGPGYGMGPGMMSGYGPGYGMGPGMMYGYGPGYGMGPGMMYGYGYGPRGGYGANLSPEQQQKLQNEQQKFYNDTQKLRDQIQEKRFALRSELSQPNPDAGKVGQLQKDLSGLESQFSQKALQHQLEVRKILPDDFQGQGYGYGRGYGAGYGGYCGY
jgi:Spy/CpxP family protein refolding chaperone